MTIVAKVNEPFEALTRYAPTGLPVGDISVSVYDPTDGTVIVVPTTAGITEPRPHTYRVSLTSAVVGDGFQIRWEYPDPDNVGETLYAEEDLNVTVLGPTTVPVLDLLPEVMDVADLLQSRTRLPGGGLAGTFTSATEPSDERVERLISKAYDRVISRVGVLTSLTEPDHVGDAKQLITIYAAMMVELTHYSEQINTDKSAYKELKKLYDDGMLALVEALGGDGLAVEDEPVLEPGTYSGSPYYDFPPTSIGDGVMP